jgi:hypothetical protein
MRTDIWELHSGGMNTYFRVSSPSWEEERFLNSLEFEKNWGKLIDYSIPKGEVSTN